MAVVEPPALLVAVARPGTDELHIPVGRQVDDPRQCERDIAYTGADQTQDPLEQLFRGQAAWLVHHSHSRRERKTTDDLPAAMRVAEPDLEPGQRSELAGLPECLHQQRGVGVERPRICVNAAVARSTSSPHRRAITG